MRCKNCGSEIEQGTKFCVSCGTPVMPVTPDPAQNFNQGQGGFQPAPQKAVVRQRQNKKSPVVIVLIIICVVAVMAAAGFGIGRLIAGSGSDSDTKTDTKTEESKSTSDSDSKTEESSEDADGADGEDGTNVSKEFPGVSKNNKINYRNVLKKKMYKQYNDGEFSFVYPAKFFNNVEKTEYDGDVTYRFTGSDGVSELIYEKTNETGDPKNTIIDLSEQKASELSDVDYYPYKAGNVRDKKNGEYYDGYYPYNASDNDSIHGIVSGFKQGEGDLQEYTYFCSDGRKVYTMSFTYPESEMGNDTPESGYMAECYYRGFSKSNAKTRGLRKFNRSNY